MIVQARYPNETWTLRLSSEGEKASRLLMAVGNKDGCKRILKRMMQESLQSIIYKDCPASDWTFEQWLDFGASRDA